MPGLLRRNFTAPAPDRAWVGDITYLPIADGKSLYLATVIDVFSRRLLGWSTADHMRAELVTDALNAAVRTRGGRVDGVIFHSDHGAQGGSPGPSTRTMTGAGRHSSTADAAAAWTGCTVAVVNLHATTWQAEVSRSPRPWLW